MIAPDQIRQIFPNCPAPDVWARAFSGAFAHFKLDSRNVRAALLAVVANETGGLVSTKREDGRYTAQRASEIWTALRNDPRNRYSGPNNLAVMLCATVPQDKGKKLFSYVYANQLGNGPPETGDGWNYRGNGPIQITFKATHDACGKAIGLPLVTNPDVLSTDPGAGALSAAWFVTKYKPQIVKLWEQGGEGNFLAGAAHVGVGDGENTKRLRLEFYRRALEVILPDGYVRENDGNVIRQNVEDSGIVKDADGGQKANWLQTMLSGGGFLGAGSYLSYLQGIPGWVIVALAVIGVAVVVAGIRTDWKFRSVKKRRRRMHRERVA